MATAASPPAHPTLRVTHGDAPHVHKTVEKSVLMRRRLSVVVVLVCCIAFGVVSLQLYSAHSRHLGIHVQLGMATNFMHMLDAEGADAEGGGEVDVDNETLKHLMDAPMNAGDDPRPDAGNASALDANDGVLLQPVQGDEAAGGDAPQTEVQLDTPRSSNATDATEEDGIVPPALDADFDKAVADLVASGASLDAFAAAGRDDANASVSDAPVPAAAAISATNSSRAGTSKYRGRAPIRNVSSDAFTDAQGRRYSKLGCAFSQCNLERTRNFTVADKRSRTLPYMYVLVPFRNRLDNLARLLTSINNASSHLHRACMCVMVVDFDTDTAVTPSWKNKSCIATMQLGYNVYLDTETAGLKDGYQWSTKTPPCRNTPFPLKYSWPRRSASSSDVLSSFLTDAPATDNSTMVVLPSSTSELPPPTPAEFMHGIVTPGFTLPLHVNIRGLDGNEALRHVLSLYDGESVIVDGLKYLNDSRIKFSRAGGIQAGLDAIRTRVDKSLVFVCDADMLIRPGFMDGMLAIPIVKKAVYYPMCWSTCYGKGLYTLPALVSEESGKKGFWRTAGTGMVVAYLKDFKLVGGLKGMTNQRQWGNEDGFLFTKFQNRKYRLVRRATPSLVHLYHSRVKDWSASPDGQFGGGAYGGLVRNLCNPQGFCSCPKGSTSAEVQKRVQNMLRGKLGVEGAAKLHIWGRRLLSLDADQASGRSSGIGEGGHLHSQAGVTITWLGNNTLPSVVAGMD